MKRSCRFILNVTVTIPISVQCYVTFQVICFSEVFGVLQALCFQANLLVCEKVSHMFNCSTFDPD